MIGKISSFHLEDDKRKTLPNIVSIDHHARVLDGKRIRVLGSIYTPTDFAEFLTSWAIRRSEDNILDVGIGEGAFVFTAYLWWPTVSRQKNRLN